MFKERFMMSSILIPIIIVILFLFPIFLFNIVVLLICMLGAWEWNQIINIKFNQEKYIGFFFICTILMVLIMLIITLYNIQIIINPIRYVFWISHIWWLLALFLILWYPNSAILWNKLKILWCIFGIFIIIPFFVSILILRQYYYHVHPFIGSWLLLYILTLIWSVDTGAYIIGKTIGYHQLINKISPHKTLEGYIGGYLIAIIPMWLFNQYAPLHSTSLILLIASIIAILTSVLGDLTESMFKREIGIKNSSQLIPGHGGILDRLDSLTSSIPIFVYLILK